MLDSEKLKQIAPSLDYKLVEELFSQYGLDNDMRQAMFLAQCAHESGNFTKKEENLNYSAERLKAVWPKRFSDELAKSCARNPEKIANIVYSNRMGNGDSKSGDGWRYRGRGYIQITGKQNYERMAQELIKSLDEVLIYLETERGALESALQFWRWHNLNAISDKSDVLKVTKIINGGTNGLDDRAAKFNKFLGILRG